MSSTGSSKTIFYNAQYLHGVDEKRRVQIPAKWRPKDPKDDVELTLVVWPNSTTNSVCLLALPPEQWMRLVAKMDTMPFFDPKAEALRRLLGRGTDQVTLDSAGRICIPENMAAEAGIKGQALLAGLVDRFQIWAPDRYKLVSEVDNSMRNEAYQQI
jgi:MraZ protein